MSRPYHTSRRHPKGDKRSLTELRLTEYPGKFEGQLMLAEWLHNSHQYLEGDTEGDENGGESYTLLQGPFRASHFRDKNNITLNRAEKRFLKSLVGVILEDDNYGFVTASYYHRTDEGCRALTQRWAYIQSRYTEDENPTEPSDDDYTTEDYIRWYEHGSRKNFTVLKHEDWKRVLKARMDRKQFWPNVWYLGERGDWNLLNPETGEYVE